MAQRTDIVSINFQANARGANAAIESLRVECERCNDKVKQLKDQLKAAVSANMPADQIDALRKQLNGATKEAKQFDTAYKELVKGMRTLDQGIKAFNDGSLSQMNQAFQKALYNAAKLTRTKLNPLSETYKRDKQELTALMDASQQYYARQQADSAMVIKTIKEGGKVSRQAINDELTAHRELLQVLAEDDAGYQRTVKNIAVLEQHLRAMGGNYGEIRKNITDTQKVSDEMLRNMYNELQKTNQEGKVTKDIMRENAKAMREIRAEQARRVESTLGGDLTKQNEGAIRQAIASAKELLSTYKTGSKQAQALSAQIVNAEEHLKTHGVEGERAARKQAEAAQLLADKYKMMQDRVKNLGKLSDGALAETQKFWQAQMDGAERGSKAYRDAEKNMKAVAAEQERLAKAQLQASAGKLNRKNLGALSEQELQTSIAAAKQLAASMKPTDAAYKQLVDDIVRAEEHVKQFGLEGQRSARQAADQMKAMEDRMKNVKALSSSALEETRRFWQAQMDGAQRGSQAYKQAEANLKALTAEQERLTNEQNKTQAKQLLGRGNLTTMSEGSIRQAITAAKEYQQTLSSTDPMYKRLTKAIVDAEEHIKKYGLEAERAARKEMESAKKAAEERKKTDKLMHDQLRNSTSLSESALKAQEQYWSRLIDDPKTAASSLRQYEAELRKVKQMQDQMVQTKGNDALAFFRGDTSNASVSQMQEQAAALKKYRDSLPQKANADLIKEIDDLLLKTGASAKKATEQLMPLRQAVTIGRQVRSGMFNGSAEELTKAKKVLEDLQMRVEKGGRSWQKLQREIDGINIELKRTKTISEEVQAVLDKPTGRSFNELKQAVEQGRLKLQSIDRTTREGQKQFDELANKIKAADIEMKTIGNTAKGTASAFDKAWSRLKTYIGLYVGAAVAMQKLTSTMSDVIELSDKMGEVRKTTGFTADEVGRLSTNLAKLDVRTPLTQLMEVSAAAGQLGLKTLEDVQGFTEAANKLMIALPEMGKEAATEMMRVAIATGEVEKIRKQLQEGTIEGSSATAVAMEKIASTIDRLRASSASTAPEITDFVKRVGAVGAQSGITIDQVSALGSTISSLGLRIEMSATALSRMIPAIRNNAFDLAKNIGVTPETIRNLFDTGRGMEVILMILQRMKDTNMNEDSIEAMLGMSGMRDIMKDLNQQGARAGIVFAGLSQNVDELRRQLGIAKTAYEENIAIQQEFDKMNETTAAKWERLKNQVEEAFVGDGAQRFLGGIIDKLRVIIDLLVGNSGLSVAIKTVLAYWAALRLGVGEALLVKLPKALTALKSASLGFFTTAMTGLKALTWQMGVHTMAVGRARVAWKQMDLALKSNAIGAVVAALGYLIYKLYDLHKAAKEAAAEVGRFNQKIADEQRSLNNLFEPLKKSNTAQEERLKLIGEINSKYGRYLGFMLSETSSAIQLADAHALIAKRIKEEAYERRIMEQERKIQDEHSEGLNAAYGKITDRVRSGVRGGADAQEIADILKGIVDNRVADIKYAYDDSGNIFKARTNYYLDPKIKQAIDGGIERLVVDGKLSRDNVAQIQKAVYKYTVEAHEQHRDIMNQTANVRSDLRGIQGAIKTDLTNNLRGLVNNIANMTKQQPTPAPAPAPGRQGPLAPKSEPFKFPWQNGGQQGGGGFGLFNFGQQQQQQITMPLPGQMPKVNEKNLDEVRQYVKNQDDLRSYLKEYAQQIGESDRKAAEAWLASEEEVNRLRKLLPKTNGGGGGGGGTNPWGRQPEAESTDYKDMTAEVLVNRRKQMNQFVNAIQTDTDVQSVLKEDAALRKAIEKGMSSDMRTVIEWYNTERLKIQDELHARHLTNTGDWLDPKKQRNAHKQFRDEMDAYLHEIDAYYTERKTRIEEAGTDEGLTEAEIRNRTLNNEMEWQQRRAELQKLYSRKQKEVTQEELDAIYHIIAERTGDSESFVKAQIAKTNQFVDSIEKSGEKGAAIVHRWMSQVELDTERSYLKGQQALTKQMRAIEAIIDKERPFNGITKSLQESLSTMDILTGEMRKEYNELMKQGKDMTDFNNRQAQEEMKRTAFLLGEAENAYSTNIDRVMDDMRQKGMTAWADWLSADPKLQEALMAQLRSTYDAIQDAIKKEASQLKKQAEIMWNNILMPDGKTTLKQQTDRVIAQLGLDEGRVKRANSLIGAGQASERVADKLAIQQMKIQLAMQEHYYNLMRKQGQAHVDMLKAQAKAAKERGDTEEATRKTLDAQHAQMSLNLATSKEETELAKQREDIIARTEESQNRLYQELRSWADLMTSSVQGIFEAESAGNREYYNERAKLSLTGKGGPGAGTYIIIEDEGTEDAKAHYEYLDERAALERQHEIELQNARADAWKKVMDDINQKMNDTITDQLNAMLQNQSIDANTQALIANTQALWAQMGQDFSTDFSDASTLKRDAEGFAVDGQGQIISPIAPQESSEDQQLQQGGIAWGWPMTEEDAERIKEYQNALWDNHTEYGITKMQEMNDAVADMPSVVTDPYPTNEAALEKRTEMVKAQAEAQKEASKDATQAIVNDNQQQQQSTEQTNKKEEASGMALYAKLTQAANLYGAAYQAMSNDNLDASQKFQMIALQAAGQAGMAALTADWSQKTGEVEGSLPVILAKCLGISPIWGSVLFAGLSAVLGGLMGIAASKIAKSKAEIAQVTKTSSAGAGRLSTGMLTYAEGNVNEFTDPASLTPGRHYNVDAADGRTYRAKYTGKNPSTHLTSGPEFHLAGERGQEMIIDAGTTRQITMNESEIWHTIQTLSGGGRLRHAQRRGRGVRAFAEGNVDDFEEISEVTDAGSTASGMGGEQMAAFQSSLDRNNELLERALTEGIHARFDVYGKGGLIDSYDQGKKTVSRHGEKY